MSQILIASHSLRRGSLAVFVFCSAGSGPLIASDHNPRHHVTLCTLGEPSRPAGAMNVDGKLVDATALWPPLGRAHLCPVAAAAKALMALAVRLIASFQALNIHSQRPARCTPSKQWPSQECRPSRRSAGLW